jgi:hypothetical protein
MLSSVLHTCRHLLPHGVLGMNMASRGRIVQRRPVLGGLVI